MMSQSLPPNTRPATPKNIRTMSALVANSNENPLSEINGTRCTIGTAMHRQQTMIAQLIQMMTSPSERFVVLKAFTAKFALGDRRGDSRTRSATGMPMNK